jgi:hypothetical protein
MVSSFPRPNGIRKQGFESKREIVHVWYYSRCVESCMLVVQYMFDLVYVPSGLGLPSSISILFSVLFS